MNSQKKNIECEIRGCITKGDFNEIRPLLEQEWGKLDEGPELVVFFKGDHDVRLKVNKHGCVLGIKKTINADEGARQENELTFRLDEVQKVIRFLAQLGFTKGLFSYCYRYDGRRGHQSIAIKFETKIGDVFEIEEMTSMESNFAGVHARLVKIAAEYMLRPWTQKVYRRIITDAWKGVNEEMLMKNGKPHPLIQRVIQETRGGFIFSSNATIAEVLKKKSNDYTSLERMYRKKSGDELLSWRHIPINDFSESVSIVIPSFNSLKTLRLTIQSIEHQILSTTQKKLLEVIVVDDGSSDGTEVFFKKKKFNIRIRYIKQNNCGRVYARNLGASIATGEILIFLDADVILERRFLNEHIARHHYIRNAVFISFKENVPYRSNKIKNIISGRRNIVPNIRKDFRFEKTVFKNWLRIHRHVRNIQIRTVKIIEETNSLKRFGNDTVLGVWDLPATVVTVAVSMRRLNFERVGGFNLQFKGWGMEDTFLGACLIADGNYVIPCFSTGVLHVQHKSRSGFEQKKIQEFNKNVLVYLDLIHRPISELFKQKSGSCKML